MNPKDEKSKRSEWKPIYQQRLSDSINYAKGKVRRMMQERRIRYFAPADYTEGSEIDRLLKAIILRTAANECLEEIHYSCKNDRE